MRASRRRCVEKSEIGLGLGRRGSLFVERLQARLQTAISVLQTRAWSASSTFERCPVRADARFQELTPQVVNRRRPSIGWDGPSCPGRQCQPHALGESPVPKHGTPIPGARLRQVSERPVLGGPVLARWLVHLMPEPLTGQRLGAQKPEAMEPWHLCPVWVVGTGSESSAKGRKGKEAEMMAEN